MLYAAGFVPVMVGTVVVLSLVEDRIGFDNFTTFRYNGDVAAAASIFVIGGLIFGLLDQTLVWLERLRTPTVHDHLRHCAVLYVFMGTLSVLLVATYERLAAHGVSLGYGLAVVGLSTAGYAVLIDALLLLRHRRRSDYVDSGDPA
jgi:Trk-type K+ transport system membrane component